MYRSYSNSMDAVFLIPVIVGILAFIIHCVIATEFSNIAESKGHVRKRYWHFCFWCGIWGYLMVIALPNLRPVTIKSTETDPLPHYRKPEVLAKPAIKPTTRPAQDDLSGQLPEL